MKVFFNCSIRGFGEYKDMYEKIASSIKKLGHVHTYNDDFARYYKDDVYHLPEEDVKHIYTSAMRAIGECDVLVLEVSLHSLTQGYILHKAIFEKKPIIILHLPGQLPAFAVGIESDKMQIIEYTEDTLYEQLKDALEFAKEKADIRFNLFISSEVNNYITTEAQKRDIPKSAFIRELVEKHKQESKE